MRAPWNARSISTATIVLPVPGGPRTRRVFGWRALTNSSSSGGIAASNVIPNDGGIAPAGDKRRAPGPRDPGERGRPGRRSLRGRDEPEDVAVRVADLRDPSPRHLLGL